MIRSMYSGIGGMKNFQTKLDVIGNNIANVNTFGFKKGRTTFKDLVSQQLTGASNPTDNRGGTNPRQIGLGGTIATVDTIHTQGSLQTTGRALDLGISGDGFFIVNDGPLSYYTRAGNFYLDSQGTLVTSDGLKVQGFRPNADGQIDQNNIGELKVEAGDIFEPQATTQMSFKGNLRSETPVGIAFDGNLTNYLPDNTVLNKFTITDSLGSLHDLEIAYHKSNNVPATWTATLLNPIYNADGEITGYNTPPLGNIVFDANGRVDTTTIGNFTINPTNGSAPINVNLDVSKLTQFGNSSNTADVSYINGNTEGTLESFNISQTGEINGIYSNGEVRILGQIAMATFNNTGGLSKSGDNLFQVSNNSGIPNIGFAGQGRGVIAGSSLEMSNVDLSEEFTEMIVAQRGFQANTRMITTSDEILQELVNLKR
ncbi:flagellar hook protein FlgE [Anaerobacillus isosaccharinicus]|uniref:Flagellar hook protein FlgE n=1 Tax=Anaerobacillus isosaccharinicus TaxID=1532552 RepID=A0A1S2KZW8_9BACI|nr:flagellar hook protein FlgE [Anaerobacillus isosaccharinicus]QOY37684.1 flagellar hook protein FlgE [Anaerobacillus isosaccharinicus]